jgi:hypothetical protein
MEGSRSAPGLAYKRPSQQGSARISVTTFDEDDDSLDDPYNVGDDDPRKRLPRKSLPSLDRNLSTARMYKSLAMSMDTDLMQRICATTGTPRELRPDSRRVEEIERQNSQYDTNKPKNDRETNQESWAAKRNKATVAKKRRMHPVNNASAVSELVSPVVELEAWMQRYGAGRGGEGRG